jgi:DNA-binding NtrC family response regulator
MGGVYNLVEGERVTYKLPFLTIDGQICVTDKILRETHNIICESGVMRKVIDDAIKVAQTGATVLLTGESGTGKELVARLIHKISSRRDQMFVPVNCAAFTDTLLESELFGHEKGAFTGAIGQRTGVLEGASKGTLLLDEVAEMSTSLQAKILRAIQYKTFNRVGAHKEIKTDVRYIAATNKDLLEEVEKKNFREDLYYRLNVVQIYMPALRHRPIDIIPLTDFFLERHNINNGDKLVGFKSSTIAAMKEHHWPGNVRELENAIERATLMCDSNVIYPEDLPTTVLLGQGLEKLRPELYVGQTLDKAMDALKTEYIKQSLIFHNGSVKNTAKTLGIQRTYLSRLITRHEINREEYVWNVEKDY